MGHSLKALTRCKRLGGSEQARRHQKGSSAPSAAHRRTGEPREDLIQRTGHGLKGKKEIFIKPRRCKCEGDERRNYMSLINVVGALLHGDRFSLRVTILIN